MICHGRSEWDGGRGFPRTALDRVGLFDESIRAAADWDMWLRLAAAGPILEDPRPLMLRRRHARQWSKSRLLIAQADEKVLAKTLTWLPATRPDLVPFARRRYARALRRLACAHLAEGRPAEGMTFLRQSATIAPLNLRTYALMLGARFMRHP